MPIARTDILRLYKNLRLYSKSLKFTDPVYFRRRVAKEFRKNKALDKSEDITFAFQKGESLLRRGSVV